MTLEHVARALAQALLAGDWTRDDMVARGRASLGKAGAWLEEVVASALEAFPDPPRDDDESLAASVAADPAFRRAFHRAQKKGRDGLEVAEYFAAPPAMRGDRRFDVPELATATALARWLAVRAGDLDWFADTKGWLARGSPGRLHHYTYRWIPKANGSRRLIEAPKEMLKDLQRRILDGILARVPPHEAAHGFRPGRSAVSYARPHAAKDLVLRMDLRDFFPSVGAARVMATFRALGYPRAVALLLTGLVTTRTPDGVLAEARLDAPAENALRRRHLPQGAPTSPAISNLCAFGLDVRLTAAAASVGARYTRYADDLAFSGGPDFRARAERFRVLVCRIAAEEGFTVHWEKNRWMRPSVRQRLAGLVVNERPRPSRAEFDRVKAILTNCARTDPEQQNRGGHPEWKEHLRGLVARFEHVDPARGARLRARFDRISW
jgi:hypothetical protein